MAERTLEREIWILTGYKVQVAGCRSQVAGCRLQVASFRDIRFNFELSFIACGLFEICFLVFCILFGFRI